MAKTLHLRPLLDRLHRMAGQTAPAAVVIPAQPSATDDHYTWAVNAAVENGQFDLVEDIAASYATEA